MSIINAEDLEASPLADLHALASTLGIDGFRRLRKPDLVETILKRQGGAPPERSTTNGAAAGDEPAPRSSRSRRRRGGGGGGGGRTRDADPGEDGTAGEPAPAPADAAPRIVEGVVELLANGSGFVTPDGASDSDSDVYISAAQARRCELVAGDRVSGPVRAPRRSERHPSLIRIDTINGVAADEAVHGTRIDDIEVDWPSLRVQLDAADPILEAVDAAAPFGAGSRVVITGPPRSGKTLVLARLAAALAASAGFEVELIAVGVRPEELSEYRTLAYTTSSANTFAASREAQEAVVDQAVERGRRVAVRGGNAVLAIDTLDGLGDGAARRALAAARNLRSAGSLTVLATAREPLGGETTVIALASSDKPGALDGARSGTLRPELLVEESKPKAKRAPAKPRAPRKRATPAAAKVPAADAEAPEGDSGE
jgi:transcription termination factor Rho